MSSSMFEYVKENPIQVLVVAGALYAAWHIYGKPASFYTPPATAGFRSNTVPQLVQPTMYGNIPLVELLRYKAPPMVDN